MIIEHIAIWTNQLEELKSYYTLYFKGVANKKYINEQKGFQSYFISFNSGARIEIMSKPGIPENKNDVVDAQYQGLIHFAFGVESVQQVKDKEEELRKAGYPILSGPRATGDGYYEFETLDPDNNRIEVTTKYIK